MLGGEGALCGLVTPKLVPRLSEGLAWVGVLTLTTLGDGIAPFLHDHVSKFGGFFTRFTERVILIATNADPTTPTSNMSAVSPMAGAIFSDFQYQSRRPTANGVPPRLVQQLLYLWGFEGCFDSRHQLFLRIQAIAASVTTLDG